MLKVVLQTDGKLSTRWLPEGAKPDRIKLAMEGVAKVIGPMPKSERLEWLKLTSSGKLEIDNVKKNQILLERQKQADNKEEAEKVSAATPYPSMDELVDALVDERGGNPRKMDEIVNRIVLARLKARGK